MELSGLSPAVRKRLEALAVQFQQELPGRIDEIREAAALLSHGADRPDAFAELRLRVHKLAGAAATFGFEALAGRARKTEHAIDRLIHDDSFSPELRGEVDALVQHLIAGDSDASALSPNTSDRDADPMLIRPALHVALCLDDPVLATGLQSVLADSTSYVYSIEGVSRIAAPPDGEVLILIVSSDRLRTSPEDARRLSELVLACRNVEPIVLVSGGAAERVRAARIPRVHTLCAPFSVEQIAAVALSLHEQTMRPAPAIAIIGGAPETAEGVRSRLAQPGWRITHEVDPDSALDSLALDPPALVLVAGPTGDISANDWISLIYAEHSIRSPHVVVLERDGSAGGSGYPVLSMEQLSDPRTPAILQRQIRDAHQRQAEICDDAASGLLSAPAFDRLVAEEIGRASRANRGLTAVTCLTGAASGSRRSMVRMHRLAAGAIAARVRRTDLAGVGGLGVFHLLLVDTEPEAAVRMLTTLQKEMDSLLSAELKESKMSIAIGAAGYPEFDGPTAVRAAAARAARRLAGGGVQLEKIRS